MDQWVIDDLKQFQDFLYLMNGNESALSNCAMVMMKMLNGLSEMSYTKFYRYEKKMIWEPMRLFSKQCIEQMYIALNCQSVATKREYIVDIESSISNMVEVYKNITGGVSNVERQIFESLSADVKIYDLSPKLCAFYSSILENVVSMFSEKEAEYAFILHPSLYSAIEAKVLLEKREQSGKVVIIYISESLIEEFDVVAICLLHEAFHVLTKSERMRYERAKYFMIQMLEQVQRQIFCDVFWKINKDEDRKIKEMLISYCFRDIDKQLREFEQWDKNDKRFYGKNIKIEVVNKFKEYLGITETELTNIIANNVLNNKNYKNYSEYQKQAQEVENNIAKIKGNIYHIVSENLLAEIADQIMFIYRETYADIACILLLEMTPELYEKAFAHSIQFQYDSSSYVDDARILRESIVRKVLSSTGNVSPEFHKSWNEVPSASIFVQNTKKEDLQSGYFHDMIEITTGIMEKYEGYLVKCASAFSMRLQNLEKLGEFRLLMKKVIMGSPPELLQSILSGDVL